MKKLYDLNSRENRNIFKLEIDKIMADDTVKGNGQFSILKTLNSPSSRPFSFTVLIGGERFTDLFLRLLDSPGKSVKVF
jgi:hypothetical protein